MEEIYETDLRIVLVGKTGVGKSAAGNTILGRREFESKVSCSSVTSKCQKESAEMDGKDVCIVDTPGLFDTRYSEKEIWTEIAKCICLSSPGPHAFLIVIQLGRFTQEEQKSVKMIQEIFGTESSKYTIVLFSHGERLMVKTIEEFISDSEQLTNFISQCQGGYCVFNNEDPENRTQVTELLQKIDKMVALNGGGYYTTEMYQQAEAAIEEEKQRILKKREEKRKREEEELKQNIRDRAELEKAKKELEEKQEKMARLEAEQNNDFIRLFMKGLTLGAIAGGIVGSCGGALEGGVGGFAIGGPLGAVMGGALGAAGGAVSGAAGGGIVGAVAGATAGAVATATGAAATAAGAVAEVVKQGKCTIQ